MIRRLRPDGSWPRRARQQQLVRAAASRWFSPLAPALADRSRETGSKPKGPLSRIATPSRGLSRALSVAATASGGGGKHLCCPNCGSSLVLAESLAESAAAPPQMHPATAKPVAKDAPSPDKKASAEPPTFKKGDVVKCVNCNLHFALKSHPPPPSATPTMEPPRYRNPAAAAALSSLSSSLSAGVIQTRGSSIGSTGAGSASAANRTPPPPASVPGRRMNGKHRSFSLCCLVDCLDD